MRFLVVDSTSFAAAACENTFTGTLIETFPIVLNK